jgi:hypothetical protein
MLADQRLQFADRCGSQGADEAIKVEDLIRFD